MMQNHFELFQLPQRFTLDAQALNEAFHEVQGRVHPDKFAHAADAEKRVALQWATRANEAYQTLKHPLKRATYLCELNGVDLQGESNTAMSPAFLMQQMEWREALDDARAARDLATLESLELQLRGLRREAFETLGGQLDAQDFAAAATGIRQLMFIEKFAEEVGRAIDALSE